ncbi:hypothetical protein CAPTEDRAFT_70774, partial [Capitella teleta]
CSLPVDAGPCEALMSKWFFNSTSSKCEPFNYGGCQGNANRFNSKRRCERRC